MDKFFQELLSKYNLKQELHNTLQTTYQEAQQIWGPISEVTAFNQLKILQAFQKNRTADFHLHGSTGYGYGDTGREVLEDIWADIFKSEKALVRPQIASGTHAIALCLYDTFSPMTNLFPSRVCLMILYKRLLGSTGKREPYQN